jgi:hypothetical protein
VNIPVKAYTAVRDHDVHFHRLEKKSGARVRNRKVSDTTGKEVDDTDVEMGFEVAKGRYVTFSKKGLDELRPASTKAVDVTELFRREIDPVYYERTYWLAPDGDAAKKAYSPCWRRWASGRDQCQYRGDEEQAVPHGDTASTVCWPCRRCDSPTRSFLARRWTVSEADDQARRQGGAQPRTSSTA